MVHLNKLTHREQEIIQILIRGKLDKEIADELDISLDTVKKHNKSIYKKLNVRNRSEVIALINTLDVNDFFFERA
ncbi:helix-turn-helix transcriptional regulator [Asinibacterium sp. OR53]|uniref:helix-turn-helix domain-containing protein n=1 Tax=Asinibacterium sp. OR53 TaxID=925409 RepID=UPI00047A785E|nr:helix-turn-helix transcriptional regulator [Asinibacterium sp. OR53]